MLSARVLEGPRVNLGLGVGRARDNREFMQHGRVDNADLDSGLPGSASKVSAPFTTDAGGTRKPGDTPPASPDSTMRTVSTM